MQSLPAASFNLIQQVGRLIRSHGCWGEVGFMTNDCSPKTTANGC
ncbi:hypothetical protein T636_A1466 [Enterobacter hormaechei subsp. xiangfangensis]|nr:hypothetical protein T636_A1466 [Enterobacter hormaechei subsp. xiangfangensis]